MSSKSRAILTTLVVTWAALATRGASASTGSSLLTVGGVASADDGGSARQQTLAVSQRLNYQGYLTDTGGTPLTGSYSIVYRIFDVPTGGTALWSETQTVSVSAGIFNVLLGPGTPTLASIFLLGADRYLELEVAGSALSPRSELAAVAYAFTAERAHEANNAATLAGFDIPGLDGRYVNLAEAGSITSPMLVNGAVTLSKIAQTGATSGDVIKWNGSAWIAAPDAVGADDGDWIITGNEMYSGVSGNVGIGTTDPDRALHVESGMDDFVYFHTSTASETPANALRLASTYMSNSATVNRWLTFAGVGIRAVDSDASQYTTLGLNPDGGPVGIGLGSHGSADATLHVRTSSASVYNSEFAFEDIIVEDAGNAWLGLYSDDIGNVGSGITFAEHTPSSTITNKWAIYARTAQNVGDLVVTYGAASNPTQNPVMMQVLPDGTTKVKVLQITGADLAERFPVRDRVEPGMVVEIDPSHPGQLRLASGAYNRRVAGVVSGAGGLSVGAILGSSAGSESSPPIALSGRVWVHCDAGDASIRPGDLLTTASRPGHAMKAIDYPKAQGATIGKAMTELTSGVGLVLVLVSLQ